MSSRLVALVLLGGGFAFSGASICDRQPPPGFEPTTILTDPNGPLGDPDGDGIITALDKWPHFNDRSDFDGDGVPDVIDLYPFRDNYLDSDSDSIPDIFDAEPNTPIAKVPTPRTNTGAPPKTAADKDSDGDGVIDRYDPYPSGEDQYLDSDGDYIPDIRDSEPNTDAYGDSDLDGISNYDDTRPNTSDDWDGDGRLDRSDYAPYDNDEY